MKAAVSFVIDIRKGRLKVHSDGFKVKERIKGFIFRDCIYLLIYNLFNVIRVVEC